MAYIIFLYHAPPGANHLVTESESQFIQCTEKTLMAFMSQGVSGSLFKSIHVLKNSDIQEMDILLLVGETSVSPVASATGYVN